MTIHQNLIAGEWTGTTGAENINPSDTNEVVGLYASASVQDVADAIAAAKAAFPAWSRSGILERHSILRKTSDEILARKDELGALLAREEGKTLPEAIGETIRAAQIFDFFAGEALRLAGEVLPSVRPNIGVEITRERLAGDRHHHALELPDRHSRLEDRAGALLRQYHRLQARRSRTRLLVGDRRYP
jgi:aldehyde dehydrogenase (NAD+)